MTSGADGELGAKLARAQQPGNERQGIVCAVACFAFGLALAANAKHQQQQQQQQRLGGPFELQRPFQRRFSGYFGEQLTWRPARAERETALALDFPESLPALPPA